MQKKNAILAVIAILVTIGVIATVMAAKNPSEPVGMEPAAGVQVHSEAEANIPSEAAPGAAMDVSVDDVLMAEADPLVEPAPVAQETAPAALDVKAALADRGLGEEDAPVVIREFASLACPHCAHFSKTTFVELQQEYIDRGKVYFIYSDFPLNASALEASIIARCLPENRYYQFIKFLFDTQEEWAFSENYRTLLLQNAKLAGGTEERLRACIESTEMREGLIARLEEYRGKFQLESTPSFIINDEHVLRGAITLADFKKIIDPIIAKKEAE